MSHLSLTQEGNTRLPFALLLKYYTQHGRFPRGRADLPDEAVDADWLTEAL